MRTETTIINQDDEVQGYDLPKSGSGNLGGSVSTADGVGNGGDQYGDGAGTGLLIGFVSGVAIGAAIISFAL